ncbi:MAG: hypothetical protein KAQ63_02965 [Candidatus Moranbacteria bacterium]|nr:hypothetical protein [Candidatus Moranbacteria bacterium]
MTLKLDWTKKNATLQEALIGSATAVITKMTTGGFTEVPERQAVYFAVRKENDLERFFRLKIGTTFPDNIFQEGCFNCSAEKEERINKFHLDSSYEKRNEKKKRYGGAIKLIINDVVWLFSISGLREPEDQSASLLIPHLLIPDHINLKNPQVQNIISISSLFENKTPELFENVSLQLTGT